jgi:predicted regulator of Ras-like GTPase activity (Roadblock/LC7/MglB family)
MGFLKNILNGREIGRLEELLDSSPAPSLFLRLSQLYRETGEESKAQEITRKGAELFPNSEELTRACENADRVHREADKERLRSRIEQYPSPILYARLAELYLKDKDWDAAGEVCRRGERSYPDYGGLWYIKGKIALARENLNEALQNLEKAVSLDEYNYNAMQLLADAYLDSGQIEKSRQALEKIRFFAPNDEKIVEKLANLNSKKTDVSASSPTVTAPVGDKSDKMKTVQIPGVQTQDGKKDSGVGTSLHLEIKQIRRVAGVRGTILIDPYGLVIASDLPDGMNEDLVAALLTNLCRSVNECAQGLTLGEFEEGIIDSEQGRVHVLEVAEMTMGVFATEETKAGLLQRAIHTFAERVIDVHH